MRRSEKHTPSRQSAAGSGRSGAVALKPATEVSTPAVVAVGLLGGWQVARETGIRPLGGVVLGLAGAWAARSWAATSGAGTAAGLTALYVTAFGASHPLAKRFGSWPAMLTVTAVTAGAACLAQRPGR